MDTIEILVDCDPQVTAAVKNSANKGPAVPKTCRVEDDTHSAGKVVAGTRNEPDRARADSSDQCPSDEPHAIASTGFVSTLEKIKEEIRSSSSDDQANTAMTDRYKMACVRYGELPIQQCVFGKVLDRRVVDLSNLNVGDTALRPVVETLFFSNRVTKLVLSNTEIGLDVLERLSYLFELNEGIEYLDVGGNNIGPGCEEYIERILNNGTRLEYLDMSENGLEDSQLSAISRALNNSPRLSVLILRGNDFLGGLAAMDLADCLSSNDKLQNLDLSSNKFGTSGATRIFRSLRSNACLKALNLSANEIGSGCGVDLGLALDANSCLEELDLSRNLLTKKSTGPIGKGLESNTALESLNLAYNPLFAKGAAVLLNAIASSGNKVGFLDLSGVRVDKPFLRSLSRIRASGRSLEVKYGHRMRCGLCEASWPRTLSELMEYADRKGTDLRSVMTEIRANFFKGVLEGDSPPKTGAKKKDTVAVTDASSTKAYIEANRLVQNLVMSPIRVPGSLARQFVIEFANDEGIVDIAEVILKIPNRVTPKEPEKAKVTAQAAEI